jgi:uncharacterized protein YggE
MAERATLTLQVESRQLDTAAEATTAVRSTAKQVVELIAPHCPQDESTGVTLPGAAISHYSMSTMDTRAHRDRVKTNNAEKPDEWKTTYSVAIKYYVKFSDFAVLNTLVTRFSAMENVKIQGIDWKLTDATLASIQSETRKAAAQHAVEKAHDYAEAFAGVKKEELAARVIAVEVSDQGYYTTSSRPHLHLGKGTRRTATIEKEEFEFLPEDVSLEVTVTAKFVIK